MEAFTLLKYWKNTATGGSGNSKLSAAAGVNLLLPTPTLVPSPSSSSAATGGDEDDVSDPYDDGHFFDLEFTAVPPDVGRKKVEERESEDEFDDDDDDEEDGDGEGEGEEEEDDDDDDDVEHGNLTFSPSDDLFFKGKTVQIDGSDSAPLREMEDIINAAGTTGNSLMKSATKLRVFMLGLKRSKSESKQILPSAHENIHRGKKNIKNRLNNSSRKFTMVRLKMEEVKVPIISLLSRHPSNTVKNDSNNSNDSGNSNSNSNSDGNNEEKKGKNEVVQRYLNMVRPLYVKVSKKNDAAVATAAAAAEGEVTGKSGKQRMNLKVIARKHLGKTKSAVVHTMSSVNGGGGGGGGGGGSTTSSKKSDDSLLQQQDGIQSAILHCKRSFNSSSSSSSSSSEDGDETTSVSMQEKVMVVSEGVE